MTNPYVFQDPEELVKKVGELPRNVTAVRVGALPSMVLIDQLIRSCRCQSCGLSEVKLLDYHPLEKNAGLLGRCKECHRPFILFLSEEPLSFASIVLLEGSPNDPEYRSQVKDLKCPRCSSSLQSRFRGKHEKWEFPRAYPVLSTCPGCDLRFASLFWDSPMYYFKRAVSLSHEVPESSAKARLVFLVAAMETYLQKAFLFQSRLHKTLVEKRVISFQSLQDAREYFRASMGIDLMNYTKSWDRLSKAVRDRNGILHNAGFDKELKPIDPRQEDVEELGRMVKAFVESVNQALVDAAIL